MSTTMSLNTTYDCKSVWETCPADILLILFKQIDVKSVLNCRNVNNFWKNVVDYHFEHFNLWETVVKQSIHDEGVTFKEKSMLDWRDMFLNAEKWFDVRNVTVMLHNHYGCHNIKNIYACRDNLVVVSNAMVEYLNIENFQLSKTKVTSSYKYEETSSLIVEVSKPVDGCHQLTLINKLYTGSISSSAKIIVADVGFFKLHLNRCYIFGANNILWVYIARENVWGSKFLAKYYGYKTLIRNIHINKESVYVLLTSGDVLRVDPDYCKFEKIFHFDVPLLYLNTPLWMFHNFSLVYKGLSHPNGYYVQKKKHVIAMSSPIITCALEHGHCVIFGYENGKIEIYLIRKLLETNSKPDLEFNLSTHVTEAGACLRITAIEVYENNAAHHLFVTTLTDLYELLLF